MSDLNEYVGHLEADYVNAADVALIELRQKVEEIQLKLRRERGTGQRVTVQEATQLVVLASAALGAIQFRGLAEGVFRDYQEKPNAVA